MNDKMPLIILAGGSSRRMGGVDKALITTDGMTYLRRIVHEAQPLCHSIVVVGATRTTEADLPVMWTLEPTPGTGPLAGLAAGFAALALPASSAGDGASQFVAVLSCDAPYAARALPLLAAQAQDLTASGQEFDAVLALDAAGHRQPLIAIYQRERATHVLLSLEEQDHLENAPLKALVKELSVVTVPISGIASVDVDTPNDRETLDLMLGKNAPHTQ